MALTEEQLRCRDIILSQEYADFIVEYGGAYKRHEQFHLEMVRAMRQGLDEEQCQVLTQAMRNLRDHFKTV